MGGIDLFPESNRLDPEAGVRLITPETRGSLGGKHGGIDPGGREGPRATATPKAACASSTATTWRSFPASAPYTGARHTWASQYIRVDGDSALRPRFGQLLSLPQPRRAQGQRHLQRGRSAGQHPESGPHDPSSPGSADRTSFPATTPGSSKISDAGRIASDPLTRCEIRRMAPPALTKPASTPPTSVSGRIEGSAQDSGYFTREQVKRLVCSFAPSFAVHSSTRWSGSGKLIDEPCHPQLFGRSRYSSRRDRRRRASLLQPPSTAFAAGCPSSSSRS